MSYGIKQDYVENPSPRYFLDDATAVRGLVCQPDVYTFAELLGDTLDDNHSGAVPTILDVGCGWGDKLDAMHSRRNWSFIGLDYGANIERCRQTFKWGTWLETDLETVKELPPADVIICSDVIEHLVDPVPMLCAFKGSYASHIVLSTPERDVQYGYDHMGPSPNECHVREWNAAEFKWFLESEGLTVDHIGLTRGNDESYAMGTILAVAH